MSLDKDRLSVWIPRDKRWMIQAIDTMRRKAESQGIPLSEGDVIILALEGLLRGHVVPVEHVKEPKAEDDVILQRTVTCRKDWAWVVAKIDDMVEVKQAMGAKTTFSYELFRLARNGLSLKPFGIDFDARSTDVTS